MKTALKLINALDKVEVNTLQDKIIKQDGINAMLKTIKEAHGEDCIIYKPGKGFVQIKVIHQ